MNPLVILRIVKALLVIGSAAYGVDQYQKRKKEQAENRVRLQQIEAELASKEQQLATLRASLSDKNEQVRIFAVEIDRLRSSANEMRHQA